jgi:hypothetical protein
MMAILDEVRMRRVLARVLDPNEFLSDHGVRSLSRVHLDQPVVFEVGGKEYRIAYLPGESDNGELARNGNWRGPVWMPENALLIRALAHMYTFYGKDFKVECPTGSGHLMNLFEVAKFLACRIAHIFLRDGEGRRPVYGGNARSQSDPHWRDYFLFYQYFHGDTGAGLGASHQTGWTGLAPAFVYLFETLDADLVLEQGLSSFVTAIARTRHGHARRAPAAQPRTRPSRTRERARSGN